MAETNSLLNCRRSNPTTSSNLVPSARVVAVIAATFFYVILLHSLNAIKSSKYYINNPKHNLTFFDLIGLQYVNMSGRV